MKRNRLPNKDKQIVFRGLVSILSGCKLSNDVVLQVVNAGNPSMFQRVCRWIAGDPLYRQIGLNQDSFKRAVGLWIAYKAGCEAFACTATSSESQIELEGSFNEND